MNTDTVLKRKWFWTWQDDQEEAWLSAMANQGLHLENISMPGIYQFRKGEPANTIYRLDFQPLKTKDRDSYQQLFADAGWELVGEMGWVYFRYKVTNGETPEIYSDPESKIGKYQRVLTYLVIFIPVLTVTMATISKVENSSPFFMIIEGISVLVMFLLAAGIFQLFRRIKELKHISRG